MSLPALLLIALLTGCADPYEDARKLDTIEAYEKFLSENPDHARSGQAKARLAELELEEVRKKGTLEAYDAFVAKYTKGKARDLAMKERKPLLVSWAEAQDSVEGWQKVVDDYSKSDRKLLLTAQRRLSAAREAQNVGIGEVTRTQVNAAGDPKGALDAWQFTAPVTNKGNRPARHMVLAAQFLKEDGSLLTSREWPVVAKRLPEALPLPPGFDTPIAPGETRAWTFKAPNLPEGWTTVKLRLAEVRWEGADPNAPTGQGKAEEGAAAEAGEAEGGKTEGAESAPKDGAAKTSP